MKKTKHCWLLLLSAFATLLVLISGCGQEKRRVLHVVTETPYAPFEYYDGDKLCGIDIDIMQEIARRLNCDLKFQTVTFDKVIESVTSGKAELAVCALSITEERRRFVDFSIPYFEAAQVIVTPNQSTIRRPENLQGKQVGVLETSTGEAYVKEKFGKAVSFSNSDIAATALAKGKVDALVLDHIPAETLVSRIPHLRMLPEKLTEEHYGIAVNKAKPKLLAQINQVLAELLKTGWVTRTVKKNIGHLKQQQRTAAPEIRKLKIGIVPCYPPYESKKNGMLEGIDIDIIRYICDEIGYEPFFVEIGSDTIFQSLAGGDITLCISSLTITEERRKSVDFSIPYSEASQRILVSKKSQIRKKEDLKGKPVGVVIGTTSEALVESLSTELEKYSEPKLVLSALAEGSVEAVVLDDFILKQALNRSNDFRLLPDILMREKYGIAISKKVPELTEKINRILLQMEQDGSLARIHRKYIGSREGPSN